MADVQMNIAKPRRIEDGSVIGFQYGGTGDVYLLNLLEPGTLQIEEGTEEAIIDYDRGVMLDDVRAGDQRPHRIRLQAKVAVLAGANEMQARMSAAAASGLKPSFTLTVKIPDYVGATSGDTFTCTKCVFVNGFNLRAGANYDLLDVEIISPGVASWAAYP